MCVRACLLIVCDHAFVCFFATLFGCMVSLWAVHAVACRRAMFLPPLYNFISGNTVFTRAKKRSLINNSFCLSLSCLCPLSFCSCASDFFSLHFSPSIYIYLTCSFQSPLPASLLHHYFFSIFWWLFSSFLQICPHAVPCGLQQGSGNPASVGCKKERHSSGVGSSSALGNKYYVHSQVTHTVCTPWLMWALICALLYYLMTGRDILLEVTLIVYTELHQPLNKE